MIDVRKLSVLAITALLVTGTSGVAGVAGTAKTSPTTTSLTATCLTSTSLTDLITCLINSVGDDTFSTIDLTTLVSTLTSPTPITALHTSTASAARTQTASSSSTTSTQHYGPYASGSPDSGTCGNNWADDTFDRHFTIFQNKDGSTAVVEQFKDGGFVTPSATPLPPANIPPNASPGGCQNSVTTQGLVKDGVTGNLHGYFVIPIPSGVFQTSHSQFCDANANSNTDCTTTKFIDSHFSPACYLAGTGTCPVTTFFDHYGAPSQSLIENEWKNASADRGGNSGDIRSSNVP